MLHETVFGRRIFRLKAEATRLIIEAEENKQPTTYARH
jgi:hypothetical protein